MRHVLPGTVPVCESRGMPTSDPNGDLPPGSPPPADAEKVARAFDRRQGQSDASEFFVSLERSMPTTWVTWSLMTINVAVFLALLVAGVHWMEPTAGDLLRFGADWAPRTRGGQWWRLLTSTFLHVGLIHLLVNMYSLKVLGPLAERLLGHAGFLLTYLVAGVTGSLASNAFGPGVVSAGASVSLYGKAWHSYWVEVRDTRNPANAWRLFQLVPATNDLQVISGPPKSWQAFRVSEFVADPPLLDIRRDGPLAARLVLYGPLARSFRVESTNLLATAPAAWPPTTLSTGPMTNTFRIFPAFPTTEPKRFYRAKQE